MPSISRSRPSTAVRAAGVARRGRRGQIDLIPAAATTFELDRADLARLRMLSVLCHRRWSLPILAELHKESRPGGGGGAKFVTLANRMQLSRETLRDTLDDLIANDYLMRNPGVGHPMRPEYMLTEGGHAAAPLIAALITTLRERGLEDVALRKWSLPVLHALARGQQRFGQLKTALPGITARALTLALKDLLDARLIERTVIGGYPPAPVYCPTRKARRVTQALARLGVD
jgi:DNA-binding HxlR family transcriptional regulator